MKISDSLKFGFIISLIVVLLFAYFAFEFSVKVNREASQNTIANDIAYSVSNLRYIATFFYFTRNESYYSEFMQEYNSLSSKLSKDNFDRTEEFSILGEMKKKYESIQPLFLNLYSESKKNEPAMIQEYAVQFIESTYDMESKSSALSKLASEDLIKAKNDFEMIMMIFVSVMITILFSLFFYGIRIAHSISDLNNVIKDISKGNLEKDIDKNLLNADNELGDLLRSFERTKVSLRIMSKRANEVKTEEDVKNKLEEAFEV